MSERAPVTAGQLLPRGQFKAEEVSDLEFGLVRGNKAWNSRDADQEVEWPQVTDKADRHLPKNHTAAAECLALNPRRDSPVVGPQASRRGVKAGPERLRIFISSPGDVGAERAVAAAVVERLQLEFRGTVVLETYLWERRLLLATETFQTQILDICEADLAIFIMWSRLGTALPDEFRRADGSRYNSGTEFEFEQARASYETRRRPATIFYLKTADVQLSLRDRNRRKQQTSELDAVARFVDQWFRNPDGTFKSAFREFEDTAQFEQLFEYHLRDWIRARSKNQSLAGGDMWTGSPFRGLEPFDFEHALIYCGRTGLVSEVIAALSRCADAGRSFLMIVGMSGAGKSSLVRAGVLPMLSRPRVIEKVIAWRRAVFRPSDSRQGVLASFAAALTAQHALPELSSEEPELGTVLREPRLLVQTVTRVLDRVTAKTRQQMPDSPRDAEARLILVVDQFEEIFDETLSPDERASFADLVTAFGP
jgi:hypothetical protein